MRVPIVGVMYSLPVHVLLHTHKLMHAYTGTQMAVCLMRKNFQFPRHHWGRGIYVGTLVSLGSSDIFTMSEKGTVSHSSVTFRELCEENC